MFKLLKRVLFVVLGCVCSVFAHGQCFSGELATELHWNMKQKVNWTNQLRLNLSIPLWNGAGSIEASTLHMLRTNETIIDDWQGFSNIEEENTAAAIAVLGYMHQWERAHLFLGVRNVNEDFFTFDVTSLFFNGSCGIFPTIAASYPIANYPLSGLTVYFDVSKGGFTFRNSLYNGVGYNGWSKHDNPFLVRPKKDGIFNMSQLEFSYSGGNYFAGAAVHTRHYGVDPDGNQCDPDQSTKKGELRLVGVWRTEGVASRRQGNRLHGAVFREHQPRQRLLPLCRVGGGLHRQLQPVRIVGAVRPILSGCGIFARTHMATQP